MIAHGGAALDMMRGNGVEQNFARGGGTGGRLWHQRTNVSGTN